ncbi:hypothetical protein [Citrobacter sp. JGM124]|uniref:hypothetical protein n=1 Tax=Citrobacter sp. JGM124 TaxID=2799789 RepID=UPI001BA4AB6A|nr:hypothetical protein [Citrobacter sp. JGM124]MBS0847356.1 hypothetical protein [Citrobacter sp. JGM124]
MKKYIFFISGDKTKIIPKEALNRVLLHSLKEEGFKRHYVEISAENKKQAIAILHKNNEDNLTALAEFSGDILLYVFLVFLCLVVFYFNI